MMLADEYDHNTPYRRNVWLLSLVLSLVSCCREAPGQIAIKEAKQAYWSFPGAELVNGQVVAPVDAKPKLDRVEMTIRVETVVDYKFGQLKARRLPNFERVTLDEVSKNVFKFKPSAPEGTYLLEYSAFDPEKGIASDEVTVTLERSTPTPTPADPVVPDPSLPAISTAARKAMQSFVASMALDMDKASAAIDARVASGKPMTVLELAAFTNPLDVETRNGFKKSMAVILEPKLGNAQLPADASKTLKEVAAGFRSVK